jgi:Asp-tRNA(Asn)/Glu-tRNA(Gln) amidotransferase A subunit family amidase
MQSLRQIRRAIAQGHLTPREALDASLAAIARHEPQVGAFVHRLPDSALAPGAGPLAGIALGVQDIIDSADLPTQMGAPAIFAGNRPQVDAPVLAMARTAGATLVGKTTTTPFAFMDPTATRNPKAPGRTPGGSSSGSAAAVAAGMIPLAIGTQTGGSVIRPAAFCGVAAIKPSYRLLPPVGVKIFAWSLDTIGLFAAGVADLADAMSAITGDPRFTNACPDEPEARSWRIGLCWQREMGTLDAGYAAAIEAATLRLASAGAQVATLALPPQAVGAFRAHGAIQDFEARQALHHEWTRHATSLPPRLRATLDAAQSLTRAEYEAALAAARAGRAAIADLFATCDIILTPSAPGPAPEGYGSTGDSAFNRLWTLLGLPCVQVPALSDPGGLPLGLQVVAPFGADHQALAAAQWIGSTLQIEAGPAKI